MLRYPALLVFLICPLTSSAFVYRSRAPAQGGIPTTDSTRLHVGVIGGGDKQVKQKSRNKQEQEATNALLNAKNALQKTTPPTSIALPSQDTFAAAAGGALLGAGLDVMAQQPVDPIVPAALLGSAAFVVSTADNETGRMTREVLGKPTAAVGNFFVQQVKSFCAAVAQKITSLPEQLKSALVQRVEQTQAQVAAWPTRFLQFLQTKSQEAVLEVQRWPQKWAAFLQLKAQETAKEVSATPARMARMASAAAEEALREAQTLPRRKIDELIQALDQMGVEDTKVVMKYQPTPPKTPPPADKLQDRPSSVLFRQFKK